jgi:hypothetical protein
MLKIQIPSSHAVASIKPVRVSNCIVEFQPTDLIARASNGPYKNPTTEKVSAVAVV